MRTGPQGRRRSSDRGQVAQARSASRIVRRSGVRSGYLLAMALVGGVTAARGIRLHQEHRGDEALRALQRGDPLVLAEELSSGRLSDSWRQSTDSWWGKLLVAVLPPRLRGRLDHIAAEAWERAGRAPSDSVERRRGDGPQPTIEQLIDPGRSLHSFYEALLELESKQRAKARVLFFGTSEIGHDRVTSQLRRSLQERFGDGGKGWVLVDRTWSILDHRDVGWRHDDSNWQSYSIRVAKLDSRHYGLGGVLAKSVGPAWVEYETLVDDQGVEEGYHPFAAGTAWSHIELHYQSHPQGTPFVIDIDDGTVHAQIPTRNGQVQDEVFVAPLRDGRHRLRVDAPAAGVHLYGAVLERERGVVIDALMVIGAWSHSLTNCDPDHLKAQISRRDPALMVFQLGAKESLRYPELSPQQLQEFAEGYGRSVRMAMAGRQGVACLIVSPKDQGWERGGRIETRPAIPKLVEAAQGVAAETGCAFYNLYDAMGGEGTARRWFHQRPRLISSDYGHLEEAGSIRIGEMLSDLILDEYEAYAAWARQQARTETLAASPEQAPIEPPSPKQLAAFTRGLPQSPGALSLETCSSAGRAAVDCRDPLVYIRTPERGQPLWAPHLQELGGGYVGVGADHAYNLIAAARSRWAWLIDDDPTVTALHHITRVVVLDSPSPQDFVQAFAPEKREATRTRLAQTLQTRANAEGPARPDAATILGVFDDVGLELHRHFRSSLRARPRFPRWGWLHVPEQYAYIRALHQQGRIAIVQTKPRAGVLDAAAVRGIADGARALGTPVRVLYLSNLESRWKGLPKPLRENLRSLPFDARTVVLRTVAGRTWNRRPGFSKWHYVLQDGRHYQRMLGTRRPKIPDDLAKSRHQLGDWLSWIGPLRAYPTKEGSATRKANGAL